MNNLLTLEGRWFITRDEHGRTQFQGQVHSIVKSSIPPGDLVLVQYCEWIAGELNTLALVPLASMIGDGSTTSTYVFFENNKHLQFYMEHYQSARDRSLDARRNQRSDDP